MAASSFFYYYKNHELRGANGGANGIECGVGFPSRKRMFVRMAFVGAPSTMKITTFGDNNFPRAQLQPPVNNFYFSTGIAASGEI
jgi:hypothetical protein